MALGGAFGLVLVARDAAPLCVAGLTQSHIYFCFSWQAWCNLPSTFVLGGRRGAISHPTLFCVAGVALIALSGALGLVLVARDAAALCVTGRAQGGINLGFMWQVWHHLTSTFVLHGSDPTHAILCVTGTALSHIHLRFSWHNLASTVILRDAWHNLQST